MKTPLTPSQKHFALGSITVGIFLAFFGMSMMLPAGAASTPMAICYRTGCTTGTNFGLGVIALIGAAIAIGMGAYSLIRGQR